MTRPDLLGSRLPVAAAPMAGGPSTVALARAVADAGGFPFLAGGYADVAVLAEQVAQVRALGVPFGVNLFVPSRDPVDAEAFARYAADLQPEADVYRLRLDPVPVTDDDGWRDKLALLLAHPVPVVSLTFGLPDAADVAALQSAGSRVLATVTTPEEAVVAQAVGVDGLVVQGSDAGGHSATFDPGRTPAVVDTAELVRRVLAVVDLPVVGAGGVDSPGAVQRVLAAGADAVAVGTALLLTDEAGTSATHRAALAASAGASAGALPTETVVTWAFTGRPARALRNGFVDRHTTRAIVGYPAVHHLTRALRRAAGAAGDADRLHLWAGVGYRTARGGGAGDLVRWLAGE